MNNIGVKKCHVIFLLLWSGFLGHLSIFFQIFGWIVQINLDIQYKKYLAFFFRKY